MKRFAPLIWFVITIWIVFIVDTLTGLGLARFGIQTRNLEGLIGTLTWPFLHGGLGHLINNSVSLLIFGSIICLQYPKVFVKLSIYATIVSGLIVWIAGRQTIGGHPTTHIGASGLVFAYFGYLVLRGFIDRRFRSIIVSILVILLWGGMIWGVLPSSNRYISWEGHLAGLLAGASYARYQSKRG